MAQNPTTDFRLDDPYVDYKTVHVHDSPVVIDWKGKIGYGDIISPICYAFNLAEKNQVDVVLNFHWADASPTKYKEKDKETIQEWVDFIANHTQPVEFFDVQVNHVYSSKLGYNHDNYDADDISLHNMRFSTFGLTDMNNAHETYKQLALVTTIKHKQQLKDYDPHKTWKDPIGDSPGAYVWPKVSAMLNKRGWNTRHVHYEHSCANAVKILTNSRCVFGYHGAHMWMAKWLGLPMIIFSKGGKRRNHITTKAFPWAVVYEYWTDFNIDSIEEMVALSIKRRDEQIEKRKYYLTNPNLYRLRGKRT
jgi:hypothetical protein